MESAKTLGIPHLRFQQAKERYRQTPNDDDEEDAWTDKVQKLTSRKWIKSS